MRPSAPHRIFYPILLLRGQPGRPTDSPANRHPNPLQGKELKNLALGTEVEEGDLLSAMEESLE